MKKTKKPREWCVVLNVRAEVVCDVAWPLSPFTERHWDERLPHNAPHTVVKVREVLPKAKGKGGKR